MNRRGLAVLASSAVLIFAGSAAQASWWNPATWAPVQKTAAWMKGERTDVLVVTGNCLKPRLLAEMIQQRCGAPILLLSPADNGAMRVFYMPSGADAVEIGAAGVAECLKTLSLKKIVVLGDGRYVSEEYVDAVKPFVAADGFIPFVDGDWAGDAKTLSGILGLKGLDTHYARRLQGIDEVLARVAAPQIPVEPVVAPVTPVAPPATEPVAAPVPAAPAAEPVVVPAAVKLEAVPAEPAVAPVAAPAVPEKATAP